jgi:hypothetical protein
VPDLLLLMRLEFWASAPDTPFLACGIQTVSCALTEHGSLKFGKGTDNLHHHATPGEVVSIASVKLWNPAPACWTLSIKSARLLKSVTGDPASRPPTHHPCVIAPANDEVQAAPSDRQWLSPEK